MARGKGDGGSVNEEFFRVEAPCEVITFRLSEIVAIATPNRPGKPAGWPDGYEGEVYLRNRNHPLLVTNEQLLQLKDKLELK